MQPQCELYSVVVGKRQLEDVPDLVKNIFKLLLATPYGAYGVPLNPDQLMVSKRGKAELTWLYPLSWSRVL